MKIYVFGNELVEEDRMPLLMLSKLRQAFPDIVFVITDPNENFPPKSERNPIILDTAKGIRKPCLLNLQSLARMKNSLISPHDYDLLFHLLLCKKLGKIDGAVIIAVPFTHVPVPTFVGAVQGSVPQWKPEIKDAMGVNPWSFTSGEIQKELTKKVKNIISDLLSENAKHRTCTDQMRG